jgi:hypothetical protein
MQNNLILLPISSEKHLQNVGLIYLHLLGLCIDQLGMLGMGTRYRPTVQTHKQVWIILKLISLGCVIYYYVTTN